MHALQPKYLEIDAALIEVDTLFAIFGLRFKCRI